MAFGNYCRLCGGVVDNVEFNFAKEICCECEEQQEQEESRRTEAARLAKMEAVQMELCL